jgi:hypothetical protein
VVTLGGWVPYVVEEKIYVVETTCEYGCIRCEHFGVFHNDHECVIFYYSHRLSYNCYQLNLILVPKALYKLACRLCNCGLSLLNSLKMILRYMGVIWFILMFFDFY